TPSTTATTAAPILTHEATLHGALPISDVTIGDNNGTVSTGSISGMTVTTNKGAIVAAGQGTMTDITIGTNDGSILAPEDSNAGSGSLSDVTIGDNNGTVSTGSISRTEERRVGDERGAPRLSTSAKR